MIEEIWKPIEGYENLYEVSTLGQIRSLDRVITDNNKRVRVFKSKIIKTYQGRDGYWRVNLYKNGILKHFLVHRLVAKAFIPNPNNLPYINHKDENPSNPIYTNLEWCTHQYNMNYGTIKERSSISHTGKKQTIEQINKVIATKIKPVNQYTKEGILVKVWNSMKEACIELNIQSSSLTRCCQGKRKTAGGYKWEYNQTNNRRVC